MVRVSLIARFSIMIFWKPSQPSPENMSFKNLMDTVLGGSVNRCPNLEKL